MEPLREIEALTLRNKELEDRCRSLQDAVKMQGHFSDIAGVLSSAVELNALAGAFMNKLIETTGLRAGAFYLLGEGGERLDLFSKGFSAGKGPESAADLLTDAVRGKDISMREVEDAAGILTGGPGTITLAAFPCIYESGVNSVILVADDSSVNIEVLSFISALTPNVALSVNNALSYDRINRTTRELANEKNKLNTVIKNMTDGLIVTSLDNTIMIANPAVEQMLMLPSDSIVNRDVKEIFTGIDIRKMLSEVIRTGGSEVIQEDFKLGDKVIRAVSYSISAGEEMLGVITVLRDITKEWEVDRMKTDFISTVSHELRTPLTSVIGFARLIKKKLEEVIFPQITSGDARLRRAVSQVEGNINIIVSEGQRLTELINDVLDIAKMEAGKIEWKMEPLSLAGVIERATEATSSLFEPKDLRLVKEIEEGLPLVTGDRDRLIQVVINLISNAVKFTDRGSVTCRASRRNRAIEVSVSDSGTGIAVEDLPKVFEKFKQVGDTLTDKPKGTGLGLPICKEIVEHHGGRIWATSILGQGSTFSFTLPAGGAETEMSGIDTDMLIRHLRENVTTGQNAAGKVRKTVLVVDDEAHIREFLRQVLEENGYEVKEAKDGLEAIAEVKKHKPDIITLDIMMPGISGFDVAAVLKSDLLTSDIPIIILSIIEDKERGYRLGIDNYLTKPIDVDNLLSHIELLLSKGTSRKKVLVIDEDLSVVKALRDILDTRGYQIIEASSGREGLEKAQSARPDMIIVDSVLSERHNIVSTLRFEKGMENILFILMAEKASAEKVEEAKNKIERRQS